MAMTEYGLKQMGFKKYTQSDILNVNFTSVSIYSIPGFRLQDKEQTSIVEYDKYTKAIIGNSLNDISRQLLNDDFVENEEKYIQDKKMEAPFFFIVYSLPQLYTMNGGYRKIEDKCIYTYDGFPPVRKAIQEWESKDLPTIVTALSAQFSSFTNKIEIIPSDNKFFGKTDQGIDLIDYKLTISANPSVSNPIDIDKLNFLLNNSKSIYSQLDKKSSRSFYSAINEKDKLKQFLYFFFFIERYTHKQYKQIDFNLSCDELSKIKLESFSEAKNLTERFNCCAYLIWELEESDNNNFRKLIKIRNRLSHGEDVDEKTLPIKDIYDLALKLLQAQSKIKEKKC